MSERVPLDGILGSKAGFLLSYPRYDEETVTRRIHELRGLGVESLELLGRHMIDGIPVQGKGHVGVVVSALVVGKRVALKIRRIDADRVSFEGEAEHLKLANSVSVGPVFLGVSENFLLMELVEGEYLIDWVGGLRPSDEPRLQGVFRGVLDRARRLDVAGLDHGELSRASRHIIMAGEVPHIVDFESASTGRRCRNVTSVSQFLFRSREMRRRIRGVTKLQLEEELLEALRVYSVEPSDGSYLRLLDVCGLAE
ncbi:MAG: serine/threonine protein kinase [Candidatus Bathyarchaeota archaeon]|nr:MAG: serine/threonine protein kinase [Candidatus Bathyarchaeota archaeon]